MNAPGTSANRRQRGLAVTEMVLVLPLVLLLILATAEFGRALWQYNVLTQSVRDAARHAAGDGLFGSTGVVVITDNLRREVQNLAVYGNTVGSGAPLLAGHTPGDVTIEPAPGGDVLVRSRYGYTPLFGRIPDFRGGGTVTAFDFEAAVRMRAL
jgi:hypothetical protein